MFYFCTPWEDKKLKDFLMFSEGMEMEHWLEIADGNTENFYERLLNIYLQLLTSRALFSSVTVRYEWDLNPQLLD